MNIFLRAKNFVRTLPLKRAALARPHKGFTLIEFIVIISIFAIMASVALFNFNGFRSNVSLNNLTHDIALTIRQAQVFGWSTESFVSNGIVQLDLNGDPIQYPQGIHFTYGNDAPNVFDKSFTLYGKNDTVTGSYVSTDTTVDTIRLQGPIRISEIRKSSQRSDLLINSATQTAYGGLSIAGDFSIAFSRPRPEAMFYSGAIQETAPDSDYVAIYISDEATPAVFEHVIIISRLGEIEVR